MYQFHTIEIINMYNEGIFNRKRGTGYVYQQKENDPVHDLGYLKKKN